MRRSNKDPVVDEEGLMDPLWEFILDDHDSVDEGSWRKNRTRSQWKGKGKDDEESGLFDGFFDQKNMFSDKEAATSEAREDRSMKRHRGSKGGKSDAAGGDDVRDSPTWDIWSSNSQKSDKGDSATWDMWGSSYQKSESKRSAKVGKKNLTKNPESTNRVRSDEAPIWDFWGTNESNREKNSQVSNDKKNEKRTVPDKIEKKAQKNKFKDPTQKTAAESGNKKGGILSRFRKKDANGRIANKAKKNMKPTATEKTTSKPPQELKSSAQKQEGDQFGPLQLFMEMAEALDPFASDDDSESSESESSMLSESEIIPTPTYMTDASSAMDRLVEETREDTNVNEIRLNYVPMKQASDCDTEREDDEGPQRRSIGSKCDDADSLDENSIADPTTRKRIDLSGAVSSVNDIRDDTESKSTARSAKTLSQRNSKDTEHLEVSEDSTKQNGKRRWRLKALMCFADRKNNETDTPIQERTLSPAKHVTFVATDMLPVEEKVTEQKSVSPSLQSECDVSTEQSIAESHFPQSIYDYEQNRNDEGNMDTYYTAMGLPPRSSMVVRKLGGPPPLIASEFRDDVIIQIETSTVSETDCIIRQGLWWRPDRIPLANTPGAEIVGKIHRIKPHVGIKHGFGQWQWVMSLTKWGGNSRFMAIEPSKLVQIPAGIEPTKAVCLPETYLTAFQVLHMGHGQNQRFERNALRGKSILIIGSMATNLGKAIIELALCAGAASIFATAKRKHWPNLIDYGVMPLSQDPCEWIDRVEGTMDLILASNGAHREDVTPVHFKALNPRTGQLIMCGHRVPGRDQPLEDLYALTPASSVLCSKNKELVRMINRWHSYDVYEQWDNNLDLCKRDLHHLMQLLLQGKINPKVLDRIPLTKVAKAHELLETKRLDGFIICEPWMKSKKRAVYV